MLKTEILDGNLIRTYSDDGHDLLQEQTGMVYREAVDVMPCRYSYREVDRQAEPETEELPSTEVLAEEAYLLAQANRAIIEEVLT